MTLDEAFALAERVHQILADDEQWTIENSVNYLRLECVDTYDHDHKGRYAAAFDSIIDDNEWFEDDRIRNYRFAARAATPAEAIERAAQLVFAAYDARGER